MSWAAFPAALRAAIPSQLERWKRADRDRGLQDEYCEWSVMRNAARKITRVTFTTEVPEYWEHLFETAPDAGAQALPQARRPGGEAERPAQRPDGSYRRENRWNTSKPGRLVHLTQREQHARRRDRSRRARDGAAGQERQAGHQPAGARASAPASATRCATATRRSPPRSTSPPARAARSRWRTRSGSTSAGRSRPAWSRPDGADAARFWKIERGNEEHTLRARFEVPASRGYVVGDIELGGRPIEFGGQVADRVQVWVKATVKPGNHKPKPKPCGA